MGHRTQELPIVSSKAQLLSCSALFSSPILTLVQSSHLWHPTLAHGSQADTNVQVPVSAAELSQPSELRRGLRCSLEPLVFTKAELTLQVSGQGTLTAPRSDPPVWFPETFCFLVLLRPSAFSQVSLKLTGLLRSLWAQKTLHRHNHLSTASLRKEKRQKQEALLRVWAGSLWCSRDGDVLHLSLWGERLIAHVLCTGATYEFWLFQKIYPNRHVFLSLQIGDAGALRPE